MWRLLKPIDYLRIWHPEKAKLDWLLPLALAVLLSLSWLSTGFEDGMFAHDGIVSQLQSLIAILTGFYIAALAAIATFDRPSMDMVMPGKVKMTIRARGGELEELTRRRFLSLMFGYLAFLSLALYLTMVVSSSIGSSLELCATKLAEFLHLPTELPYGWFFWFLYCLGFCQLVVITLLGLFYLADRIHREDGQGLKGEDGSRSPHRDQTADHALAVIGMKPKTAKAAAIKSRGRG